MKATFDNLTTALAAEVASTLAQPDDVLKVEPSSDLCATLERFIPAALANDHPRWAGESLDGIYVSQAKRTGTNTLELLGTCILISDQTRVPVHAMLRLSAVGEIAAYAFRLGEPGGGSLGISGPPTTSGQASRLHDRLSNRFALGQVDWVYETSFDRAAERM